LNNGFIQFKARFGGVARDIVVPMGRVMSIYARENGQGMAFPAPTVAEPAVPPQPQTSHPADSASPVPACSPHTRPTLKRIK